MTINSLINKAQNYTERTCFSTATAAELLAAPEYQNIIGEIQELSGLSTKHFQILYQQLINDFAEFVQLLPVSVKFQEPSHTDEYNNLVNIENLSIYHTYTKKTPINTAPKDTDLGSLLNQGLLRALYALKLQQTQNTITDPLLVYVLFSSALLKNISTITKNRSLTLVKSDGTFMRQWQPFLGPMPPDDTCYRISSNNNPTEIDQRGTNILLSRQLMPLAGFNWITQDLKPYNIWLALVNQENNPLKTYIDQANELIFARPQHIPLPLKIKIFEPKAIELAEDFLDWLKNGIKNKKITLNNYNSDLHIVEDGIFVELQTLIKKFCAELAEKAKAIIKPTYDQVLEQLQKIGFVNLNDTVGKFSKYTYTSEFIQKLGLSLPKPKPEANALATVKNPGIKLDDALKYKSRLGIVVFLPCFLYSLFKNPLELIIEPGFVPEEFDSDKVKKKLTLLKKLKLRRKKLRELAHSIEEAMEVQMKLNLGRK